MKSIKILVAVAAMTALVGLNSFGQGRGVDTFGVTRSIVLAMPTNITSSIPLLTNGPIDTHGFYGVACVDFMTWTNGTGANALTAQLYTSPDGTNLTALANYALATSSTVTVTNLMYGNTNLIATNNMIAPGVYTTPAAASVGWATPYLAPAQFTNTGAVTVASKGYTRIGYNVADAARYLYVVWNDGGGAITNATASALFTGYRNP